MLQHKPPLPPTLHKARLGPLMQVATAGGPRGIRTAADVGSHHQSQDVWAQKDEFGRVQWLNLTINGKDCSFSEKMDEEEVRVFINRRNEMESYNWNESESSLVIQPLTLITKVKVGEVK